MSKYKMVMLENLVKIYEGVDLAVDNVSLDIYEGEFLTLLGPSGCGKTTTLRMIAGFEDFDSGNILIDNVDVSDIPPYKRNVNTVFQNYALFPHMNIYDNIAFGLKLKKVDKYEIEKRVDEILELVQMTKYKYKMPNQISGGQKQRVAIARAIINNPKVLLLDEPLAALDYKLRKKMQVELKHLQRELGITFIYVTHDQEEALTMSDRICVMNNCKIEQVGTPFEIYENPKTKFVANFIGESNIFDIKIDKRENDNYICSSGEDIITTKLENGEIGEEISFLVRPEKMHVANDMDGYDSYVEVIFEDRIYVGSINKIIVNTLDNKKLFIVENAIYSKNIDTTKKLYASWKSEHMVRIDNVLEENV